MWITTDHGRPCGHSGGPPGRRSALRCAPPRAVARRLSLALAPSVVPLSAPLPLPLLVDRPLLTESGVPPALALASSHRSPLPCSQDPLCLTFHRPCRKPLRGIARY